MENSVDLVSMQIKSSPEISKIYIDGTEMESKDGLFEIDIERGNHKIMVQCIDMKRGTFIITSFLALIGDLATSGATSGFEDVFDLANNRFKVYEIDVKSDVQLGFENEKIFINGDIGIVNTTDKIICSKEKLVLLTIIYLVPIFMIFLVIVSGLLWLTIKLFRGGWFIESLLLLTCDIVIVLLLYYVCKRSKTLKTFINKFKK